MLWQVIHVPLVKVIQISNVLMTCTISLKIRHSALSERTIKAIIRHNDTDVRVKTSTLVIQPRKQVTKFHRIAFAFWAIYLGLYQWLVWMKLSQGSFSDDQAQEFKKMLWKWWVLRLAWTALWKKWHEDSQTTRRKTKSLKYSWSSLLPGESHVAPTFAITIF